MANKSPLSIKRSSKERSASRDGIMRTKQRTMSVLPEYWSPTRDKSHLAASQTLSMDNLPIPIFSTQDAEFIHIFESIKDKVLPYGIREPFLVHDATQQTKQQGLLDLVRTQLEKEKNGLYSDLTVTVLREVHNQIGQIIQEQEVKRSIVKAQAITRGWLVRKRMKTATPYMDMLRNSKVIFIELIKTERQYIADLKLLIKTYLMPSRAKAIAPEDIQDIQAIFSNIEGILATHQTLLREMLEDKWIWPFVHGLGALFMQHASEFKSYGYYAENFVTSRITLNNVLSNKKHRLREVIESAPGGGSKLENLLLLPIQRIAKYTSILESLSNVSEKIDPQELDIMSRALAIMNNIQQLVDRKLDYADRYAANQEIYRSLALTPEQTENGSFNLHSNTRYLVHKGLLHCVTLKKVHFFLFNDLLLITKLQGDKHKPLHRIELVDTTMQLVESSEKLSNSKSDKVVAMYELSFGSEKLQFKPEKNVEEPERIQKQIFLHKKMGVIFGISLEEVLQREKRHPSTGGSGIPKIVEFIVEYLRKNALKTEGLFRIAGNFHRVESLRKQFDNASLNSFEDISFDNMSHHDIAAVLRIYLRELSTPVIPFSFYEPLMEIQRDGELSLPARVNEIRNIIVKLPEGNVPVLKYLIRFLQEVEDNSADNKMTVSNLAIVFGPNIIRAEVETVQNALEMPLLQGIIQILIEHSEAIWGEVERRASAANRVDRPLSILFVGKELTPMLQTGPKKSGKAKIAYLEAVSQKIEQPKREPFKRSANSLSDVCSSTANIRDMFKKMEQNTMSANERDLQRRRELDDLRKEDLANIREGVMAAKRIFEIASADPPEKSLERSKSGELSANIKQGFQSPPKTPKNGTTATTAMTSPREKKDPARKRKRLRQSSSGTL